MSYYRDFIEDFGWNKEYNERTHDEMLVDEALHAFKKVWKDLHIIEDRLVLANKNFNSIVLDRCLERVTDLIIEAEEVENDIKDVKEDIIEEKRDLEQRYEYEIA